jgi:hypothetical protein
MLADELDYVIGVDTHRDRHTWRSLPPARERWWRKRWWRRGLAVTPQRFASRIGTRAVRVSGLSHLVHCSPHEANRRRLFSRSELPASRIWERTRDPKSNRKT